MKLKYTEESIKEVDFIDLEDFIKEELNLEEFSIIAENDNVSNYHVTKEEQDEYDLETINHIMKEKSCDKWELYHLLTYLCNKDIIEEGYYLVSWCW